MDLGHQRAELGGEIFVAQQFLDLLAESGLRIIGLRFGMQIFQGFFRRGLALHALRESLPQFADCFRDALAGFLCGFGEQERQVRLENGPDILRGDGGHEYPPKCVFLRIQCSTKSAPRGTTTETGSTDVL